MYFGCDALGVVVVCVCCHNHKNVTWPRWNNAVLALVMITQTHSIDEQQRLHLIPCPSAIEMMVAAHEGPPHPSARRVDTLLQCEFLALDAFECSHQLEGSRRNVATKAALANHRDQKNVVFAYVRWLTPVGSKLCFP